jgi:hypothetical protein
MGAKLGHAGLPGDAFDDFAPAPSRDRLVAIAVRFRKEHRTSSRVYGATLMKIRDQRRAASRSVANDSGSTAFAGLGSDSDETSGDIEVGDAEAYHFFATQCAVVCECEHQSIAQTFPSDLSYDANPVVVRRNRGHAGEAANQAALESRVIMGARTRWRQATAGHRIPFAQSLIDQMIVPKPKGGEPLLEGRIADRRSRTGEGFRLATEVADK